MAEDLNNVFLVGRLTRDIELSYTPNGYPVGRLSLAVNRRRKNVEQWEDEANYFDLTLWGKRAEALSRYLTKGTQIAVQGQLKQDRWEQDGQKRNRVLVEVGNIQLLGSNRNSQENYSSPNNYGGDSYQPSPNPAAHSSPSNPSPSSPASSMDFEDDIPF